jgi:transposase
VARWLKARGCRSSASVATAAVEAARAQDTALAGEQASSLLVAKLAPTILAIDDDLAGIDAQITQALGLHPYGQLLMSMPGFGPTLAATFLAQIGGSLNPFESADTLASLAGLAPVPRDSGRISGNLHRPRRFNRRLLRTCYLAALSSLKNSPASRAFYDRKRAEGKSHKQALIALARRRMNVIWAMLRDHTPYVEPATALLKTA